MNDAAPQTADYYVNYDRRVRCELCGATATRQIAGGRPGIRRTKIDCTMCSFQCYVETDMKTGENVRLEAKVVLDEVRRPEVVPLSIRQSNRAKARPKHAVQAAGKLGVSDLQRWYACGSPPDIDAWIAAGMPDKATWEAIERGETPKPPEAHEQPRSVIGIAPEPQQTREEFTTDVPGDAPADAIATALDKPSEHVAIEQSQSPDEPEPDGAALDQSSEPLNIEQEDTAVSTTQPPSHTAPGPEAEAEKLPRPGSKTREAYDKLNGDKKLMKRWTNCSMPPVDAWIAAGMPTRTNWDKMQQGDMPPGWTPKPLPAESELRADLQKQVKFTQAPAGVILLPPTIEYARNPQWEISHLRLPDLMQAGCTAMEDVVAAVTSPDRKPIESPHDASLRIFADMASLTHMDHAEDVQQARDTLRRIAATCIQAMVDLDVEAV